MKNLLYLPLFAAMLTLFGCSTEPEGIDQPKSDEPEQTIDPETRSAIEAMGFSTEGIYVTDDAYIVEGDIIIPKERVEEQKNEPQTRHTYYSGNGHIINNDVMLGGISIGIDYKDYDQPPMKDAKKRYYDNLKSAIDEFNHVEGSAIKLYRQDGIGPYIYITWTSMSMGSDHLLVSEIPLNGAPGSTIYINSSTKFLWTDKTVIPDTKIKSSLVHAIGHALGLGHTGTHQGSGSSAGEDRYSGSQAPLAGDGHYDEGSIMHHNNSSYYGGENTYGVLTDGDKAALRALYPKYKIAITGETSVEVGQTYTYILDDTGSINPLPGAPSATWKITGGEILSQYRQEVEVKITSGSIHKIEATVKVGSDPYSYVATPLILNATVPVLISGTIAPATQTIAYGATPAIFTSTANASGGEGTITYQWQKSSNKTSWTNITNAKSATYQSPALTSTTYFRRQATDGKTILYSNVATVVVRQPLQGGTIGTDDPTFAYGSTPLLTNINPATGGVGKITYKWQKSIRISVIDDEYSDIANSNTLNYQLPKLTENARYRRMAIDERGTIAYSNEIRVSVSLHGEALSPPKQFVTNNTIPLLLYSTLPSSAGRGTPTYRWLQRTFNDTETIFSEWEEIPDASGKEYQPPLLSQNTNFRLETNYEDEAFYQEANVYVVPESLIRTPIITSDKTSAIYPEYIMCWADNHYTSDGLEYTFDWYCNGVLTSFGSRNGYFRIPPGISGTISVTCRVRRTRDNALSEMSNAIVVNVTSW